MIREMVRMDTIAGRIAGQKPRAAAGGKSVAYHRKIHRIQPLAGFLLLGGLAALLLAVPLLVLLWRGVDAGLAGYLADPSVIAAARLSIMTSVVTVLATLLLGTPLAYGLARWSFRHKAAVETVIDLPIVLPPMVAGIGLLLAFGRNGLFGAPLHALGIHLPFTTAAVVFAQAFVSAPLYIRAARLGFAAVPPDLIEAAYTDGATELEIFGHVMLPLATHSMLNGIIMSWARAFGEFGATIIFAGNLQGFTQTMPLVIFTGFETNLGVALSLSLLLIMISALILLALRTVEKNTHINV
jgi:molybdate transport system permease protein